MNTVLCVGHNHQRDLRIHCSAKDTRVLCITRIALPYLEESHITLQVVIGHHLLCFSFSETLQNILQGRLYVNVRPIHYKSEAVTHLCFRLHGAELIDVHGTIHGEGKKELIVVDTEEIGDITLVRDPTCNRQS